MADKAEPHVQNSAQFDQLSMQGPPAGQTNYAFSHTNPPAYAIPVQQGQYFGHHQATSNVVVTQVAAGVGNVQQPVPYDYTTQAWFVCLCCFWPTGLVAIMKASESRDAFARGDSAGAQAAANSARLMIRISIIVGVVTVGVILLGTLIGVFVGARSSSHTCYPYTDYSC